MVTLMVMLAIALIPTGNDCWLGGDDDYELGVPARCCFETDRPEEFLLHGHFHGPAFHFHDSI
jgi:hypothetical protein